MQQPKDLSVGQRIGENHLPRERGQYLDVTWLQGNIRYIALQWSLICPCKVLHIHISRLASNFRHTTGWKAEKHKASIIGQISSSTGETSTIFQL